MTLNNICKTYKIINLEQLKQFKTIKKSSMNTTNFTTELINTIIERLKDYKNCDIYGSDLAYTLFEGENANGSVLFNTYQTKEFIKQNFDLFGDLIKHVDDNLDMKLNPMLEPEKAHVILLLEASSNIISQLPIVDKNWNNKIQLTDSTIKKLTKELKALKINDEDLF